MVGEFFEYAKDAVVGKWNKWVMLIIATILLGIPLMGYSMRILMGEKSAPEVEGGGTLFVDGIKYLIVSLIYAIPLIIVWFIVLGASVIGMMSDDPTAMMAAFGAMGIGLIILLILAIIVAVFEMTGIVRFARPGSMAEAFNFSAILGHIRRIGWLNYVLALGVISVIGFIFGMVTNAFSLIPIAGDMLGLIVMVVFYVPFIIFTSRYSTQVYDAGEEKSEPVSALTGI